MEHTDKARTGLPPRSPAAEHAAEHAAGSSAFTDHRPESIPQRRLGTSIEDSPRQVAQRNRLAAATAPAGSGNGLPEGLKAGIESLSGRSMDAVQVHRDSARPAQIGALAYAQGNDIHLGPGQEQHLPHEAWHVVQQAQGRVKPTMQMKDGIAINDDDALEREADAMGDRATQRQTGGDVASPAAAAALPGDCVQRVIGDAGQALVGHAVYTYVGPIGDAGEALIGQEVVRLSDGARGSVHSIPPGMHEYTRDINIFYLLQFPGGRESISAAHKGYALASSMKAGTISRYPEMQMSDLSPDINKMYEVTIDGKTSTVSAADPRYFLEDPGAKSGGEPGSGPAPESVPSASPGLGPRVDTPVDSRPAEPESPEAAQARLENDKVQALLARLGAPLSSQQISFTDARITLTPAVRRDLIAKVEKLHATPGQLLGEKALEAAEAEVAALELRYKDAAAQTLTFKEERRLQAEAEQLKQEALKKAQDDAEALRKKNVARLGGKYGSFSSRLSDAEIETLLGLVKPGDDGRLSNVLPYASFDKLVMLLGKVQMGPLNELLPALGGGQEDTLAALLDRIQPGQEAELYDLIVSTKADKAVLRNLLDLLGRNARVALDLMTLGGDKNEASLVAMITLGRSVGEIKSMLGAASGKQNAPDAATISAGVPAAADATTLLDTQGVKGSAAETLLLLAHAKVGNVANAVSLLDKKGTGADALALVRDPAITLADARLLMDTTGIRGQAADAVLCLARPGATVADLVTLLDICSASTLYSYLDPARGTHAFALVLARLTVDPNQTFWAGQQNNGDPAFSGGAGSLAAIIASAQNPPVVGQYAGGRVFGNLGGIDGYGAMNMLLPAGFYREYDLAPYVDDPSRGPRRMVVGGGRRFFTGNHYHTFTEF